MKIENNIICDDFRVYLRNIPSDAIFVSDPPYNQKYHYDNYGDNLNDNDYRKLLQQAFCYHRSVIIHYPEQTINILAKLDLGECQDVVSWVYNSNTAKQHRLITFWGCKPDMRKVEQPYKNPNDKRIAKRIVEGKTCRGYDWWEINQVKNVSKGKEAHSCPIPEEVARRIILSVSKEGDLIVDPFCGSGTILKVANELGRRYLGFDISKKYVDIAKNRLSACG